MNAGAVGVLGPVVQDRAGVRGGGGAREVGGGELAAGLGEQPGEVAETDAVAQPDR